MDYYLIFGMVMVAFIAIVGFFLSIKKNMMDDRKPLEELNISITRLNTNFENMLQNDKIRDNRINKHGEEIDEVIEKQRINEKLLDNHELRIGHIEKKMHI